MAKLTVNGKTIEVADGTRLVLAIADAGVAIGHRCGGKARCTTCRVEFERGEPEEMTRAEHDKLAERSLTGRVRLACQIPCDRDMTVRALMTADDQPEWQGNTGERPALAIEPDPKRLPRGRWTASGGS